MIWVVASIMVVIALAVILLPLWRSGHLARTLDSNTANIAVLKDQLQELELDYAGGNLSAEQYALARDDLQASVAADLDDETAPTDQFVSGGTRRWLSLLLIVMLPVASVTLYRQISTYRESPQQQPAAEQASAQTGEQQKMPPIDEMVEVLAARLRQDPDNLQGWRMLGKTYALLQRFPEAVSAYERAYQLGGNQDAEILVDYVEVLASANDNSMQGKPHAILQEALQIQPNMPKARWLSGFSRFQQEDYVQALKDWQIALNSPTINEDARQVLLRYVAEARELGGIPESAAAQQDAVSVQVAVHVSLDEALGNQVQADDVVFVFARLAQGMLMPLAAKKIKVQDLPTTVVLDDSMSMIKGHSLVGKSEVIIGARVSKSGSPIPQPGDLQGLSSVIDPKATAEVRINMDQMVQ